MLIETYHNTARKPDRHKSEKWYVREVTISEVPHIDEDTEFWKVVAVLEESGGTHRQVYRAGSLEDARTIAERVLKGDPFKALKAK